MRMMRRRRSRRYCFSSHVAEVEVVAARKTAPVASAAPKKGPSSHVASSALLQHVLCGGGMGVGGNVGGRRRTDVGTGVDAAVGAGVSANVGAASAPAMAALLGTRRRGRWRRRGWRRRGRARRCRLGRRRRESGKSGASVPDVGGRRCRRRHGRYRRVKRLRRRGRRRRRRHGASARASGDWRGVGANVETETDSTDADVMERPQRRQGREVHDRRGEIAVRAAASNASVT